VLEFLANVVPLADVYAGDLADLADDFADTALQPVDLFDGILLAVVLGRAVLDIVHLVYIELGFNEVQMHVYEIGTVLAELTHELQHDEGVVDFLTLEQLLVQDLNHILGEERLIVETDVLDHFGHPVRKLRASREEGEVVHGAADVGGGDLVLVEPDLLERVHQGLLHLALILHLVDE